MAQKNIAGSAFEEVVIVDSNGNQITSFGGSGNAAGTSVTGVQPAGYTDASGNAVYVAPATPLPVSQTGPLIVAGSSTTRPANTTAYALGQLVANNTVAGSVTPGTIAAARGVNVLSTALRMRLAKTSNNLTNAIFRVHLYNQNPTAANGDGAAWLTTMAGYVGSFDVTVTKAGSDVSVGIGVPTEGASLAFAPATGTANLYYLIEARAAYTPTSGEVFTPTLEIQ